MNMLKKYGMIAWLCLTVTAMLVASPVASVKVGSNPEVPFENFDDAWTAAMNVQEATVTLLADITRTEIIAYRPKTANARHTLDLNNHTITENTSDRLLVVDKADGQLTITDSSLEGNGCLYKKQYCDTNLFVCSIYTGELVMAGGRLYLENTIDHDVDKYATIAINVSHREDAKLTMTGGTVEVQAAYDAYAVSQHGTTHISGGNVITRATQSTAYGVVLINGTVDISGGTVSASANQKAIPLYVRGFVAEDGSQTHDGVMNVSGGTFNAHVSSAYAYGLMVQGTGLNLNGSITTAKGIANVSGGNFKVTCPASTATQVFAVQCVGWREFDDATPHHMIGESLGEVNISGGTFLVDTRDADGNYVENGNNVDILRNWGVMNVTGGTYTIYQHENPCAVSVYRNKTTISGNPVFEVHSLKGSIGVSVASWNTTDYCDADASKNNAELEISSGTFYVNSEDSTAIGLRSLGAVSKDGYAMNSKITVHDGLFVINTPKYARVFYQRETEVGAYGEAHRDIIVKGGKFMPKQGDDFGTNVDAHTSEMKELSGGYFPTYKELALHTSYDCTLRKLASDEPEYAEGYRYQVVPTSERVAKVKVGNTEQEFAMLQGAIRYARRQTSPAVVTPLEDVIFYGPHILVPTVDNNDITLDLNGHTVSSITATDRFLTLNKADMRFTLTDKSADQSGVWQMNPSSMATTYGLLASKGELRIAGGTLLFPPVGTKQTIALCALSGDAKVTVTKGQITAQRAFLANAGVTTVSGGLFNVSVNFSGTLTGTVNLFGGYYTNDGKLTDYCSFPYEVLPTTDADKARVGDIYQFKVSDENSERGIRLDIVDYTPSSITLNMNGFRSDEDPPYGWEVEAFGKTYHSDDCAANKTLTLTMYEPVEPDATFRISVRSYSGTIESSRFYKMPYIFESNATLPEGDYTQSMLYIRSGTLTIDEDVNVSKVMVCPAAELNAEDGALYADTLVLRSLPTRSAGIYGSFTIDKLYFTRIGPDGSDAYPATQYYSFSLPTGYRSPVREVFLSNGTTPAYGSSWVLKRTVGGTEEKLTINDIVESGIEYEIFSTMPYYREYYFPLSLMPTGMENTPDAGTKARKMLIDGRIVIELNGQWYDLMGKRMQ